MTQTLFKKVDYTLAKLLHDVEFGTIGLPDIQRPFVWSAARVRDLFDSMYRGFPVGYLLFWANDELAGTRQIGTDGKQRKVPWLLIVDGQQRLTSLFAVLRGVSVVNADYQRQRIQIAFRPRDGRFAVADAAIRRDPEFIPGVSVFWSNGGSSYRIVKGFLEHLKASREVSEVEERTIEQNIDRAFDLQNYPFTALEISSTVDEEQVADIFVRINSEGVKLNQADFILTLLSVFWDEGRAALEEFSRASRTPGAGPSPYNHHIQPDPDQLLRVAIAVGFGRGRLKSVYQILRGKNPETGVFSEGERDRQFAKLQAAQAWVIDLTSWHEFLKCLTAGGYRSAQMISSQNAVLYAYAFFLLGRKRYGMEGFRLRNLIARWFFMSSLTARYTASPETIMDGDLAHLRTVETADEFEAILEGIIEASLPGDFWDITLPNELATSSARSPALFAYYAALNLVGAPVLFSTIRVSELFDPAVRSARASLERHHLFPVNYLKRQGIDDLRWINQIANYALLEWPDNNAITDTPPAEYFVAYAARFGAEELETMMRFHALPEGWERMEYEEFLSVRRTLIAKVIREAFELLSRSATPGSERLEDRGAVAPSPVPGTSRPLWDLPLSADD